MTFKLFEILKQFMIGAFVITLITNLKPESMCKNFIPPEILNLNSIFETRNFSHLVNNFYCSLEVNNLENSNHVVKQTKFI